MKVEQLMSTPAVTCRDNDSLNTAARTMWDRDFGAIPVIDNADKVTGMLTDRDICMAAYTKGRRLGDIRISEVKNANVFSVKPSDSIQKAEKIMREHQVRRLPVVDARDQVVGLLSLNDIAREGERERSQKKKDIGSDEVLHTLAAICEPSSEETRATG